MTWSLEQAYDVYPRIEEEFSAALDESLRPRGPPLTGPAPVGCPPEQPAGGEEAKRRYGT